MERECDYDKGRVPQLESVSQFLSCEPSSSRMRLSSRVQCFRSTSPNIHFQTCHHLNLPRTHHVPGTSDRGRGLHFDLSQVFSLPATSSTRWLSSTQYIRHPSRPLYTPEPDVVHELIGYHPMPVHFLFTSSPAMTYVISSAVGQRMGVKLLCNVQG
eukprot:3935012-Rhodomonas_salina.2